jgi:hypothetical protein
VEQISWPGLIYIFVSARASQSPGRVSDKPMFGHHSSLFFLELYGFISRGNSIDLFFYNIFYFNALIASFLKEGKYVLV